MSKVKFGLSKAYYAVKTVTSSTVTYGTPKQFPGAVSLTLDPEGDTNKFYADNSVYAQFDTNNGWSGQLTIADATEDILKDLLGYAVCNDGAQSSPANIGLVDITDAAKVEFGFMFKVNTDDKPYGFKYFNCTLSRPSQSANTTSDTTDPDTVVFDITASPIEISNGKKVTRQRTVLGSGTGEQAESTFFASIALPSVTSL